MGRLAGKVALITGASGGQGAAEARLFAAEGAAVVIADVLAEQGEALAAEITAAGGRALFRELDVTDEDGWTALVAEIERTFGRLDVLVNNAGVGDGRGVIDQGLRGWDRVIDINVWGPVAGMRAVAPAMARGGGGSIVNISSVAGLTGYDHAAYTAGKWALRGVTKVAALEFADDGIRVNSVHPGTIVTPMLAGIGDEVIRNYVRVNPGRRAGTSEEIAWAVLYLASDEASFTTGAELAVDGGFIAGGANRALELAVAARKEDRDA
ncbi:glucose 1-dehydrogenase [Actinomadura viridis]|uniref:NAD(P)-dependent dehydrogenase (Short-subunit alcohol dehydrogenase family) n=1 Tax=Actinomadura viridis TaxID=58110 RepID=A0A931GMD7_9ACTN|nr:glucose 1-dehydrogenase [Actinomadura viridis]MBG6093093.1 NAD(P)-dependent dehydrogenase (short-subunit alcohol dehydrogenase family) [Actinomadura viridis]